MSRSQEWSALAASATKKTPRRSCKTTAWSARSTDWEQCGFGNSSRRFLALARAGLPDEVHITQIPSRSPDRRINQIPFFFLTQRNRLMMTGVLGGPLGSVILRPKRRVFAVAGGLTG